MPKAVTSSDDTERIELKSLPEGYVLLRRMTYGQYLTRREMMSQMGIKGQGANTEAMLNAMNRKVTEYEFDKCIVEHNLQDQNDNLLNFRQPAIALEMMDPRIGEEIATNIGRMNNFEESLGNSEKASEES